MRFYSKYSKIILSMFFSFAIVFFIVPYFMTPGRLTRTVNNFSNSLSSLKFPSLTKLFTLQFSDNNNLAQVQPYESIHMNGINNGLPPVYVPTIKPTNIIGSENPTPTVYATNDGLVDFPVEDNDINNIPGAPTNVPKPTKMPKPTKPPDIFPIDPSLARYGKTTDEVFTFASSKTCVPKEVLKGIAYIESGGFFDVVDPKYFLLYNSENWWNSQFLTEEKRACGGYDYDNGSGIVPSDSKYAGHNCHSDGSTGATSYIMGPMQVNGSEQSKFASQVKSATGAKQVDRRIILDAILIVGFISKQNVNPTSCSNWTGYQVAKAACGYYGSCGFADGTYYCNTFCRNYKSFGGKADCQGAVNQMQDNCWQ